MMDFFYLYSKSIFFKQPFLRERGIGCYRILPCVKENLYGALALQSIGLYLSDFLRLFTIRTISELSTIIRSSTFCYMIVILFICYYNGNTCLNCVKPRLTLLIRNLLKFQAISYQLNFNSCFPSYADQYFCNLHPHARNICGITGCSNQSAHSQFPQAIPYLIISGSNPTIIKPLA